MRRHIAYLKYVIRHKWWVAVAGIRYTKCSWWRLIIHDWSKFLPSEWVPYARTFYTPYGDSRYQPDIEFLKAWNHHQKRNDHHWQHWVLISDSGDHNSLQIPDMCVREMVADWMGAGRAITGKWDVKGWYDKNASKMEMNTFTRAKVELIINGLDIP